MGRITGVGEEERGEGTDGAGRMLLSLLRLEIDGPASCVVPEVTLEFTTLTMIQIIGMTVT